MKTKIAALLALTSTVFSSCDNEMNQITEFNSDKNAIAFSSYSMMSKGTPIINNDDFAVAGRSFHVAGFLEGNAGQYMNAQITFNNGWQYANSLDKAYWPTNGAKLGFYAVHPYSEFVSPSENAITFGADGSSIKYQVAANTTDQQDLMYASTGYITNTNDGKVNLQFKHALNQIHFSAKTDSKNLFVDIAENGIEIANIFGDGTLSFSSAAQSWDTANSTKTKYTAVNNVLTINTQNEADAAFEITGADALMLMPQAVAAWIPNPGNTEHKATTQTNSYLKINCKIYTKIGTDKVWYNGDENTFASVFVPFAGTSMDQLGKKITYTLIFGGGYTDNGDPILSPITFETNVVEWVTPE